MKKKILILLLASIIIGVAIAYSKLSTKEIQNQFIELHSDCNFQDKTCVLVNEKFKFEIHANKNIYYLTPFETSLSTNVDKVNKVVVDFKMKDMDMGVNRVALMRDNNTGLWKGKAVLPVCVSGRVDWKAEFEIYTDNENYRLFLPIDVTEK